MTASTFAYKRGTWLCALAMLATAMPVWATDPVYESIVARADGTRFVAAIHGYDAVAYHTDNQPVRGAERFSHQWRGSLWLFANADNLATFRDNPQRWAPQFGGFCAYGTAGGYKVSTQPEAFTVDKGKLYLNHTLAVRRTWNRSRQRHIARAERNWEQGLNVAPYTAEARQREAVKVLKARLRRAG